MTPPIRELESHQHKNDLFYRYKQGKYLFFLVCREFLDKIFNHSLKNLSKFLEIYCKPTINQLINDLYNRFI